MHNDIARHTVLKPIASAHVPISSDGTHVFRELHFEDFDVAHSVPSRDFENKTASKVPKRVAMLVEPVVADAQNDAGTFRKVPTTVIFHSDEACAETHAEHPRQRVR
jgi:hypothetical protein